MSDIKQAREALGRDLNYLRDAAGLSERKLAARLGVSQTTILRLEKGRGTTPRSLPVSAIRKWVEVTGADEAIRLRVEVLIEAILRSDYSWRDKLGDRSHLQDEIRDLESEATIVRTFQLTVIPGLLQTPEYAHYIIPVADVENVIDHNAAAAGRLRRQQALFATGRRFEFLISEAALHWPASSPELVVAQLDRITALAPLKSVDLAVLPIGEPPDGIPWTGFVIYESSEPCVEIEMTHRGEMIDDPQQVDLYRNLYSRMWARSAVGPDAVALIQRVAADLRS
jgi:transcriptional regulator with XRE-family HTH domain